MAKLDRIEGFRFWAHKIIPLVYDESLSYYEFLCKVMAKLNETIELLNKQNEELENFEEEIAKKFEELAEEFEDKMGLKFAELKDELVSDINDYFALLIPTFSEDVSYLKGDYVYHNERVYELTAVTSTGEWDSTKWADVTLTESLASRLRAITDKLDDIDEDIAQLSQSLTTSINHLKYDIVSEYDTHSDYYEGDYVYHENVIYKANQYVTAGEFDSTKWGAVVLATDIATTLRTLKTYVDTTVSNAVTQLRSYIDNAVSTAETELRTYTDGSVTTAKSELRTYTDGSVTTAKSELKTYTDGSVTTAKAELKAYVDEKVAMLQLKKANLFVSKFTEVYYNENWVANVTANQAETFYSLAKFNQNCDFTLIEYSDKSQTSLSFKQIVNPSTGDILAKTPLIQKLGPFTFYYFTNIPAGTWRFENYNDGTNDYNFKSIQHAIQHDGTTQPEQLYQYLAGLTSGELAYIIKQVQNEIDAQIEFNDDIVPWFDESETVTEGLLRRVDTEINGVAYKGVYRCKHLTAMAGPFDPQYWEKTTVASEIHRMFIQQNNFNKELIPDLTATPSVTKNALRWVNTVVNDVLYYGIYRFKGTATTTSVFQPQYWEKITVAQNIQENTTALNGYKLSDPLTQAQYDALTTVDPNTLYIIVPT